MTPEEFQTFWKALKTPVTNHELEAREVEPGAGVWVARDNADHQHLLVLVDGGGTPELDETHGLRVSVSRHKIAGRGVAAYLDLVCLDAGAVQTFATVASDVANAATATPLQERARVVARVLREWRWFWSVDPSRMSRNEAVGLFGELWFLSRWAGLAPGSVWAWEGSSGSRHDFQWPTSSVEVKTTARGGPVCHRIESLDQLDAPESGQLYLFSLRIARDALAANSVNSLAETCRSALRDDPASYAELTTKLAQRGYTPAGRDESSITYRILDESLYVVADSFPRLTPSDFPQGLPRGVSSVSYQVDLAVCADWRVETTPSRWTP